MDEKKIENVIKDNVFKLFRQGNFQKGRKILKKIYLQYGDSITDLETKRILFYNLALVEVQLNNIEAAKIHIKKIREEVEANLEYLWTHELYYTRILTLYTEIFRDEMDIDEYVEINVYNYGIYRKRKAFGSECIALTNISVAKGDYAKLIEIIESLVNKEIDEKEYYVKEILNELVKHNDKKLIDKAKFIINSYKTMRGGEFNV